MNEVEFVIRQEEGEIVFLVNGKERARILRHGVMAGEGYLATREAERLRSSDVPAFPRP